MPSPLQSRPVNVKVNFTFNLGTTKTREMLYDGVSFPQGVMRHLDELTGIFGSFPWKVVSRHCTILQFSLKDSATSCVIKVVEHPESSRAKTVSILSLFDTLTHAYKGSVIVLSAVPRPTAFISPSSHFLATRSAPWSKVWWR
jgi:hypothetical protein